MKNLTGDVSANAVLNRSNSFPRQQHGAAECLRVSVHHLRTAEGPPSRVHKSSSELHAPGHGDDLPSIQPTHLYTGLFVFSVCFVCKILSLFKFNLRDAQNSTLLAPA